MRSIALILLAVLAATTSAVAQVPAGGEFRLNEFTIGNQSSPLAAFAGDGSFVIAWQDSVVPVALNIVGRRYAADGSWLTNSPHLGSFSQGWLDGVASDRAGNFIVAWHTGAGTGSDQAYVRRFGADGTPLGAEVAVGGPSGFPDVAMLPSGEYVVVWEYNQPGTGREIFARRFARDGAPAGAEFMVNTYTSGTQRSPAVAFDGDGRFVVAWASYGQDGSEYGVFARLFDQAGMPIGGEFQVNGYTTGFQNVPDVARGRSGSFVIAWSSLGQEGSGYAVFARRFDADGVPLGGEFRVNGSTTSAQGAAIATDESTNFVVTWTGADGSQAGVFGQRFSASGAPRGSEFRVNASTTGPQFASGAASDGHGNFVVAWSSVPNGVDFDAYAQRFGGLLPVGLDVDTAGSGIFEPGEAVDVAPSWWNLNGDAQTFGGTAASFTGPQPAVYEVQTPLASYGVVPSGDTRRCLVCYGVRIPTTTRPVLHWDAVFEERITPDAQGQQKPWLVHIGGSFADVPASSAFYRFVETVLHHSITGGCGPAGYCPAASTAREQMAVFVLVAREGGGYRPPACGIPVFADVPPTSPFCPFIEELARRGVAGGCGGGNYCPGEAVTREQMPVFVLRTLDPAIDPPACGTPRFSDVPAGSPFCRWIEELARRGVVTGCGGLNYCPQDPVTREQMAVFVAVAFGLTLYAP